MALVFEILRCKLKKVNFYLSLCLYFKLYLYFYLYLSLSLYFKIVFAGASCGVTLGLEGAAARPVVTLERGENAPAVVNSPQ